MRKLLPLLLLFYFVLFLPAKLYAQLASWDFTGQATVVTSTANVYDPGLSAAPNLTRGTLASASAGANSFRTTGFKNLAISVANQAYFEVKFTAATGKKLSLTSIDAIFQGTASFFASPGVDNQFAYSLDGTNFILIGSPTTVTTVGATLKFPTINLAAVSVLQNVPSTTTVTLRFYAKGQTATGGWGFFSPASGTNGLTVGGTVTDAGGADTTPPVNTVNYPKINNITATSVDLLSNINEAGTTYYVLIPASGTAPTTVAQIKAGLDGNNNAALQAGSFANTANTDATKTINGLTASTAYKVYTVSADAVPNVQTTFSSLNATTISSVDLTPPVNTAGYPKTSNITATSIDLLSNINEAGITYYVLLPATGTAPTTALQVKSGLDGNGNAAFKAGSLINTANADAATTINGLTALTAYKLYVAAADAATVPNLQSAFVTVNATTIGLGDVTPPVNTAGYPKTNNMTTTSIDLLSNINEAGTTYYVLIPATGTAPTTVVQVKAGLDGNNAAALKSGSILNTANTDATSTISGLTVSTAYTIYTVSADAVTPVPNLQTTISTLNVSTANPPLVSAPVIISQYYEGLSVNKWIELTNLSSSPVNTASPQLKLALYNISGDAGPINITATPSQTMNLNVIIPPFGTVLIANTGNAGEVPYLTVASAAQTNNSVINFNGNDGITLLDANNNIIDAFGQGVNAKDVSYVRNLSVTAPSATFNADDWARIPLATVQNAIDDDDPNRLGVHFPPNLPACAAPAVAPSALVFSNLKTNSITGTFTASTDANEYLIIRSTNSTLTAFPQDGVSYNTGAALGGGIVSSRIVTNTFTDNGLTSSTNYYYFIFPLNNVSCTGGPKYLTTGYLTGTATTKTLAACITPADQPTNFTITSSNYNFIQGSYNAASNADEYLVVMSTSNTLTSNPLNQTVYNVGDQLGGGIVIKRGTGNSFTRSGLAQNTTYYFYLFSLNSSCAGGPLYLTSAPLTGSQKTGILDANNLNFYYGNLHSHSSYSDGNKDDTKKKPEDDYAFAKNSMKMDFLGISEHNHTQAGMSLANWQPGIDAAKKATTSTFLALHGMEWGVISGGGHVIVYGIDSLIGWEPGENQIYVPKSTYTGPNGLFRIINRHGLNAIATLAHPNTTDFNNISATYDLSADSAIVGAALESGPAFSTNITYSDPASSMSYLSYYNRMLSRGYHLGATIDHDNHNLTFGRHTRARLVVLAPALTENDLLDAIKKMRFYASEDSAAKVTFLLNKQPVGSVFTGAGAPAISVNAATTSPVTSIRLLYGTPGSGVNAVEVTNSASGTLSYTHDALANLATGYYYADIVETDGSRIITSPIWYSRDDSYVKKNQTITFAPTRSVTYGDPDLDAGATSDNPNTNITYASSDVSIATVTDNKIQLLKAGVVTITASQAGDALFNPATKQQVLTILPKPIVVTADARQKFFGDLDPMLTYTTSSPLIGTDIFSGSLIRETGEETGNYNILVGSLSLGSNYALNYKPAVLQILARAAGSISGTTNVAVNAPSPVITFTATTGTAPFTFTYHINNGADQTLTASGNTGTVNVPTATAGTFVYTLTKITDANSSQTQNVSSTVTVSPLPVATISGTGSVCVNTGSPVITFTGSNGTAPYTFTYNINGAAAQTVTTTTGNTVTVQPPVNVAGSFVYNLVSVSDANTSQTQTGNATITVNALATASISGNASVVVNATSPLITFTGSNGTAPYTFTYNINGAAAQTVTTTTGNTVTVQVPTATSGSYVYNLLNVSDANCGQPQTGTATVIVQSLPLANISGTGSVCMNSGSPLITFTGSNGTAPYTFTYNINGAAAQTVTTTTGNTVTVQAPVNVAGSFVYNLINVSDANTSQTQNGNATITVNALATASISGSTSVGVNVPSPLITFTGAKGTAPYTFTYNINGGTAKTVTTTTGNTVTVQVPTNTPGSYAYNLISVNDANCGQPQTGTATVIVQSLPLASISGSTQLCANSGTPVITFTGSNGTAPYTFTYTLNGSRKTITANTAVATVSVPVNQPGVFTYALLSVADAYASQPQTGNAVVTVNALPMIQIGSDKPLSISKGDVIQLTASGGARYNWTGNDILTGQNSPILTIRPKQSGTYTVTVSNASGCNTTQTINITVVDDYKLEAGTVITPNGDGINDKFVIKNIDLYPNNTLRIFDKTGRVIYTRQAYANDWDGTLNGSPLAEGTYYYILDMGPNIKNFKGYINIIRD